eukprot:GHVR01154125.1.p1 GENE.GHVR01154125.1~~GHVR01154125.1.p1  ORF type:complete len:224 (-),score=30.77 GHVR01154125.1:178-849(-)
MCYSQCRLRDGVVAISGVLWFDFVLCVLCGVLLRLLGFLLGLVGYVGFIVGCLLVLLHRILFCVQGTCWGSWPGPPKARAVRSIGGDTTPPEQEVQMYMPVAPIPPLPPTPMAPMKLSPQPPPISRATASSSSPSTMGTRLAYVIPARRSESSTAAAPTPPEPPQDLSSAEVDLQGKTVVQLKAECKRLGLTEGGNKSDMVSRLVQARENRCQRPKDDWKWGR